MNYLLKERKEVESDSVSVHHRDSEVAVSVAVFDDVDVSNREDQGRYAPESKKFLNPGLSSIATYSKTKTAATLASVCSYSEDRGIPGDRNGLAKPVNGSLRASQNYEKGARSFVKVERDFQIRLQVGVPRVKKAETAPGFALIPFTPGINAIVSALRTSRTVAYIDPGFRLRGLFFISNNYYASMSTS
ncbi:hypothetical protein KY284_002565 [Solanum tuberosum]|nr:hypothetical protein KY284_002565 [Solanum tuberosum]